MMRRGVRVGLADFVVLVGLGDELGESRRKVNVVGDEDVAIAHAVPEILVFHEHMRATVRAIVEEHIHALGQRAFGDEVLHFSPHGDEAAAQFLRDERAVRAVFHPLDAVEFRGGEMLVGERLEDECGGHPEEAASLHDDHRFAPASERVEQRAIEEAHGALAAGGVAAFHHFEGEGVLLHG